MLKDDLESEIGKKWTKVLSVIAVLITIYLIVSLVFSFWPFSVVRGVVTKVTSPNAIIQNYEWFYAQYAEIKATELKAEIAKGTEEEKGIKMVLASMIAEYNAKSKMITRNLWKASDLPYQIKQGE